MNIISTRSDFYLDFLSCALGWIRGRDSLSSLAINKDDLNNQAGSKIFFDNLFGVYIMYVQEVRVWILV